MRYILLASLAVSDLLFLILVNSFRIASIAQERWLYGDTMCYLNPFFARYFYMNTVLHLMAVSFDRYKSIVKSPLTHNGTLTKCRVAVLVPIWLIPIGFAIAPFLNLGEYFYYNSEVFFCQEGLTSQSGPSGWRIAFSLVFLVVPLLVIALLNWSVYKTAKLQANAVAIQIGSFDGSESQQQGNARRRNTERKAALDVSIIIAAFLLCFLPKFHPRQYWSRLLSLCSVQYLTRSSIPSAKETSEGRLRICWFVGGLYLKQIQAIWRTKWLPNTIQKHPLEISKHHSPPYSKTVASDNFVHSSSPD